VNRSVAVVITIQTVAMTVMGITSLFLIRRPPDPVAIPPPPQLDGELDRKLRALDFLNEHGGQMNLRELSPQFVQYPPGRAPQPNTGGGPVLNNTGGYRALLYGAGFAGAQITPDDFAYLIRLSEEIVANGRETNTLLRQGPAAPKQASGEITPAVRLAAAKKNCISCHTPAAAEGKGGGYIMFADDAGSALKPVSFKDRQRESELVNRRVNVTKDMPPEGRPRPAPDESQAFSKLW
jgi:hypothetical protein